MDPEVKLMWILALRSGRYVQGSQSLRRFVGNEDKFCALGVLCDLYSQETGVQWEMDPITKLFQIHGNKNYLPKEVYEFAGLKLDPRSPAAVMVLVKDEKLSMLEINDQRVFPFEQIANIIKDSL